MLLRYRPQVLSVFEQLLEDNIGANGISLKWTTLRMLPESGSISRKLSEYLPSTRLQGREQGGGAPSMPHMLPRAGKRVPGAFWATSFGAAGPLSLRTRGPTGPDSQSRRTCSKLLFKPLPPGKRGQMSPGLAKRNRGLPGGRARGFRGALATVKQSKRYLVGWGEGSGAWRRSGP